MIFSTTVIYFKSNRKKLALYRVQGFSFIRTYSSLLAMIFIQNLVFAFTQGLLAMIQKLSKLICCLQSSRLP
ncbi:DUF1430 domain-containing protein [Lactococcus petauri]|uniref:DUF1430 domain-containing protein n=1 Tax=Lactococcus petauri TaxID=1940789 RepID=UPI0022E748F5|nr:DUF1430 domain-containing protein [Lactococcus petauri]